MKLLTVATVVMMAAPTVQACEPLRGQWRSDGEATMDYNSRNARLSEKQTSFLSALMGRMTMDFGATELHTRFPDVVVPVDGAPREMEGFDTTNPYAVLFCDERVAVIRVNDPKLGERTSTFYFVAPGRMWIYAGGNDPKVPDLHFREYFTRTGDGDAPAR